MPAEVLRNYSVLVLAVNVPALVAAARLRTYGASIIKVEPPGGDPLAQFCPAWYAALHEGFDIRVLDLKSPSGKAQLVELLDGSDLLLTALRPEALDRLGLSWQNIHARYPRLAQVAIVGYLAPDENRPGHDLTYQASLGLLSPPNLPRLLLADQAGAEQAACAALALLLGLERGLESGYIEVSLAKACAEFAASLQFGLTRPGQLLGGGLPGYNLYPAAQGWVAVAALEPYFWEGLTHALRLPASATYADLQQAFAGQPAEFWESWGVERGLPLTAVK